MDRLLFLLTFCMIRNGTCIYFTINPYEVETGTAGNVTMECAVNESDATTVYNIKIKRQATLESNSYELLASFVSSKAKLNDKVINLKDFEVTGNKHVRDNTPYLKITMNTQKLVCTDARTYQCEVAYESSTTGRIEKRERNATFTACANRENIGASTGSRIGFQATVVIAAGIFMILVVI